MFPPWHDVAAVRFVWQVPSVERTGACDVTWLCEGLLVSEVFVEASIPEASISCQCRVPARSALEGTSCSNDTLRGAHVSQLQAKSVRNCSVQSDDKGMRDPAARPPE